MTLFRALVAFGIVVVAGTKASFPGERNAKVKMSESSVDQTASHKTVVAPVRVAILTNMLLQNDVRVLEALQPLVARLRIYISTILEPDRVQEARWGVLDVRLQRVLKWNRSFRSKHGFQDRRYLQFPIDTLWELFRYKPDVVISNQFGLRTVFAALYRQLRPKSRLIVWATLSQRSEAARGSSRIYLRRAILSRADACFVHGQDGEAYLRSIGYSGPVVHTPYVTDPKVYCGSSTAPDDGVLRLLFVGNLIERKGVVPFAQALIEWCSAHSEKKVLFRLGGQGPERQRLEALALPGNLAFEFLGQLDTEGTVKAYRDALVYVFPSLDDEWAMVIDEAMRLSLPVLGSTHAQAALELIQDGKTGWIFDPESRQDTLRGLDQALSLSFSALRAMGARAHERMSSRSPANTALERAAAIRDVANDTLR